MKRFLWLSVLVLGACQTEPLTLKQAPIDEVAGIDPIKVSLPEATPFVVQDATADAFRHPYAGLNPEERTRFFSGESFFDQNWVLPPSSTVARDGLGPYFNARSCSACHGKDGRSVPVIENEPQPALLFRLSTAQGEPHPQYGSQIQPFAVPGQTPEARIKMAYEALTGQYADGGTYTLQKPAYQLVDAQNTPLPEQPQLSPRAATMMSGLGLLESVPEADILALADPEDTNQDGISGRANRVQNLETQQMALGRFGWKANQPTLKQQVAGALHGDIGITSSLFPGQNWTPFQAQGRTLADGGSPEISDRLLDRMTFYSGHLSVPAPRRADHPDVKQGQALFAQLQCATCHAPTLPTPRGDIHPYSDLLLHDMGPGLADGRSDGLASGQEWRTAPLWGIGLVETVNGHTRFLHDGRARNLTEAILWHGGEAGRSQSAFKALTADERQALIQFLESL